MNDLYRELLRERFQRRPSWSPDTPRVPLPESVAADDEMTTKRRCRDLLEATKSDPAEAVA